MRRRRAGNEAGVAEVAREGETSVAWNIGNGLDFVLGLNAYSTYEESTLVVCSINMWISLVPNGARLKLVLRIKDASRN